MADEWNEHLLCPKCSQAGLVSLSQPDDSTVPKVEHIPEGFKAIQTEYGPDFLCGICNVPALP